MDSDPKDDELLERRAELNLGARKLQSPKSLTQIFSIQEDQKTFMNYDNLPRQILVEMAVIKAAELEMVKQAQKEAEERKKQAELVVYRKELNAATVLAFNKALLECKSGDRVLRKVKASRLEAGQVAFSLKSISDWELKRSNSSTPRANQSYDELVSDPDTEAFRILVKWEDQADEDVVGCFQFRSTNLLNVVFLPVLSFEKKEKASDSTSEIGNDVRNVEKDAEATIELLQSLYPDTMVKLLSPSGSRKRKLST